MMRAAVGAVLGFVLVWLAGCTSSLTGGSVPVGMIDGTVNTSTRGTQPLARVPVVLRDGSGQVLQTTLSTGKGQFAFANVPPGELEVTCTQGEQSGQVGFSLLEGVHARVVLMVAPVNMNVVKLKVQGSKPAAPDGSVDLDKDEEDFFTVQGEDAAGQTIPNLPVNWAVVGGIGDISPDGNFSAQNVGEGELIVQHDGVKQKVRIRVNSRTSSP
jgi:hypothetical protein